LREIELNSLARACKYSVIPNRLGFCGPPQSFKKLLPFIESPQQEKTKEIKAILSQFNALYPYLELIAQSNSLNPFDAAVIEAYWIGNSLLENVSQRELQRTILSFQNFGFPREIAEKKAASLPDEVLPHHSFHVLYITFISPKLEKLVRNFDNCMIKWGKVEKAGESKLSVKTIELLREGAEFKLREKLKEIDSGFVADAKKGDFVSIHWNSAIEILSEEQLQKYTHSNLRSINSSR